MVTTMFENRHLLNPRLKRLWGRKYGETPCCIKEISDLQQVKELLEAILPTVEKFAIETRYGNPVCDDPRDFSPDPECCTPEEIARWKEACERAERGEKVEVPQHQWFSDKDGMICCHVNSNPWGIGIYIYRDEALTKLKEKLKEAVEIIERYNKEVWGNDE